MAIVNIERGVIKMFGFNLNEIKKEARQYLFEADQALQELERMSENEQHREPIRKLRRIIDELKSMASKYGVKI